MTFEEFAATRDGNARAADDLGYVDWMDLRWIDDTSRAEDARVIEAALHVLECGREVADDPGTMGKG